MIKVCFILPPTYFLFAKKDGLIGGAEVNLYYLAKQLAKDPRYRVEFIVGDFGQEKELKIDNVKLIKLECFNYSKSSSLFKAIKWRISVIKKFLSNKSDVFIVSTMSILFVYAVVLLKLIKRKKIIYRVASDMDVNGIFTKQNSVFSFLLKTSLKKSDRIVTQNNKQYKELVESHNLYSEVIHNGLILNNNNIESRNKEIILWIGKADSNKNPKLFVELAKNLPLEKFVMIINGDNDVKDEVIRISKDISNLKIIDFVSFFKINEFYKIAKCFVNTSFYEGSPNTFIQAGSYGCPLVSFYINPDNMFSFNDIGIFCNGSVKNAIEFISALDKEKSYQLGKNNFELVSKKHNISNTVKQYKKLIEN